MTEHYSGGGPVIDAGLININNDDLNIGQQSAINAMVGYAAPIQQTG